MDIIIQKVGCSPPYHLQKKDVPVCTATEQMKDMASNIVLGKEHGIEPPCKSLEFMTYRYYETDFKGTTYDTVEDFWIGMNVPSLIFKVRHGNRNIQI